MELAVWFWQKADRACRCLGVWWSCGCLVGSQPHPQAQLVVRISVVRQGSSLLRVSLCGGRHETCAFNEGWSGGEEPRGIYPPYFCVAVASGTRLFSLPGPWQQALPSPGPAALGGRQLRHSTTLCSYLARVFHLHKVQKLYLIWAWDFKL